MIIGTRELRLSKLINQNVKIQIVVDGCNVVESAIERLLGVVMNNTLTWEAHLYGNKENKGLIEKLSHRVGLIFKLCQVMPKDRLKMMAEGIFRTELCNRSLWKCLGCLFT